MSDFYIFNVLGRKVSVHGIEQSSPVFFFLSACLLMPGQISSNCPHVSHTDLSLYQYMFFITSSSLVLKVENITTGQRCHI